MKKIAFNLPHRYRLDIELVKGRENVGLTPIFDLKKHIPGKLRRGSKTSRFFRSLFEHNSLKKFFGVNMVLMAFGTSLIPSNIQGVEEIYAEESQVTQLPLVVKTEVGIQYPVEIVKITQGYKFYHPGIDLDGNKGDKIKPIIAGVVSEVGYSRVGYGNNVIINHGNNTFSLYAHLSKINVKKGDVVTKDTIIGEMGATGRASGDHLHLEIYEAGKKLNPLTILASNQS